MKIAIIPARAGSKRIKNKNIKDFLGKPIIAYSIEVALKSALFDKVIVSTDSKEIAEISQNFGAEIPFIRPNELSDDLTGTLPVISHAINCLDEQISFACCMYATSPFITTEDLQGAFEKLKNNDADYCFSATTFPFPIQRSIQLDKENKVTMFYPEHQNTRSQDLEEAYHDAGQFYWGKAKAFTSLKPLFTSDSYAYVLPRKRVQDIDTLEDWERAELLYKLMHE